MDLFGVDSIELVLLGALALLLLAALGRSLWKRRLQRLRDKDQLILLFTDATAARAEPSAVAPTPFRSSPLGPAVPAAENEPVLVPRPTPVPMERTAGSDNGVAPAPAAPDESGLDPTWVPAAFAAPAPLDPAAELATTPPGGPLQHAPAAAAHSLPLGQTAPRYEPAAVPPAENDVDEASQTIRLPTAADGTVQILPGRLIMTQGPEVGREFRFLRVGSQPVPEITLGRASGSPYLHIQLPAPTVSRLHARLRYEGGGWKIVNLSQTNPVQVNGRELPAEAPVPLVDGDHIVLGEVELSYQTGRP